MKIFPVFAIAALFAAGSARAELVDINVGQDAVRANLSGPLSRAFESLKGRYEVGGLVSSEKGADLSSAHLGVLLTGDAGAPGANVTAGLGVRAQYVGAESEDGGGLALGGQVDVRMPDYERIGLFAYGYYGPEAASFGEIDSFYEYSVSLGYEVLRDAMFYVGYRETKVDVGKGPKANEDGGLIGIRLDF
jgi:hypothetical protein